MIRIAPAELVDLNICCQMVLAYTTDYVWQMQATENERGVEVRFDVVRLPRTMRVEYPRHPDELIDHWHSEGCFLVARTPEDELVGFIDAVPYPAQSMLWIHNLGVLPAHRRCGIGLKLVRAAAQWAADHQLQRLMMEMQTKNYPAVSFAQKQGFRYCGYNEQYYQNGDIALFFSRPV